MAEEHTSQSLKRRLAIIEGQIHGIRRRHATGGGRLDMVRQIHTARSALVRVAELAITDDFGEQFDERPAETTPERSDHIKQVLQVFRRVLEG